MKLWQCLHSRAPHLLSNRDPLRRPATLQHCVTDFLRFQGIAKSWARRLIACEALEKVCHLVHKAMLVTNLQAWHPPLTHVRVVPISNMDGSPTTHSAFVAMVEIGQAMQIVQVPLDGGLL